MTGVAEDPKYQAKWRMKWTGEERSGNKTTLDGAIIEGKAAAKDAKVKVVIILKEDTGEKWPENKGKWFLHRILK